MTIGLANEFFRSQFNWLSLLEETLCVQWVTPLGSRGAVIKALGGRSGVGAEQKQRALRVSYIGSQCQSRDWYSWDPSSSPTSLIDEETNVSLRNSKAPGTLVRLKPVETFLSSFWALESSSSFLEYSSLYLEGLVNSLLDPFLSLKPRIKYQWRKWRKSMVICSRQ